MSSDENILHTCPECGEAFEDSEFVYSLEPSLGYVHEACMDGYWHLLQDESESRYLWSEIKELDGVQ